MRALLVQQGLERALQGEANLPATMTAAEKSEMIRKAHNVMVLFLEDKVQRKVVKESTTAGI